MDVVWPDWRDPKLGARIRVALWLHGEIGEGRRFNKQQLRKAIPDVEQVDRRMRDLRPAGWVIKTYRDMAALSPDELYLEKVGTHVWEPGQRSAGLRSISGKVRRQVMEHDLHRCVRCGISAGEAYPDDPDSTARLTLGHVNPHKHGSTARLEDLVTECARCNETAQHLTGVQLSPEQIWDRIKELSRKEKQKLLSWMAVGHRSLSDTEQVWSRYRQLPAVHRESLQKKLGLLLGADGSDS
ncbi:HNH endonuclease [Nonomuraea basaltis]|uniref:HNH endonuclease n=1 Tax=Nonomuraea basaltis TaxID=2495887 RepID=UPI00110C6171|nr:HNH endonuclease [Nonomuraea basaltis]TMR91021.1 HNH endonuclease [Nonomuraea basaltis]